MVGSWVLALAACDKSMAPAGPGHEADLAGLDADADGFPSKDDCNDFNPAVNPDAEEICDGHDNDCDGTVDVDAVDAPLHWADTDADGYGAGDGVASCTAVAGTVDNDDDCDDTRADVHPYASEVCDDADADEDCDGLADDADSDADGAYWMYADGDGDGYGDVGVDHFACELAAGWVLSFGDCDDTRATIYPDAEELCGDGVDNDCDDTNNECRFDGAVTVDDADAVIAGTFQYNQLGVDVAPAGDVDGDGAADLLVGGSSAYLLLGPVSSMDATSSHATIDSDSPGDGVGWGMVSLGDQDADGYDDMFVAATNYNAYTGRVYGILGPLSGTASAGTVASTILTGAAEGGWFGYDVSAGDVNGDGILDLLVGAQGENDGAGSAYLYSGPIVADEYTTEDATAVIAGLEANEFAGAPGAANGDVDGDGVADVLVSMIRDNDGFPNDGTVWLFYGPLSGMYAIDEADVKISGATAGAQLGYTTASGGDLDGDGRHDVVLSAPGLGTADSGLVSVFYASTVAAGDLDLAMADAEIKGDRGDQLASSLDSAGDFDADGRDDLIVGSWFVGADDVGRVWGFYGPVSGVYDALDASASFAISVTGATTSLDAIGGTVGLVGDVSGDGTDDLAVGRQAANGSGGEQYQGYVYLFHGKPG
jgi:hypothetical protein